MVLGERGLRKKIDRYLDFVRSEMEVQKAVLYGSYAHGTPHDDSDIDLVVLSEDFVGVPRIERHQRLGWLAWQAGTDYIQPLGFTPEEFEKASALSLLGEIRERGVIVYEAEPTRERVKA